MTPENGCGPVAGAAPKSTAKQIASTVHGGAVGVGGSEYGIKFHRLGRGVLRLSRTERGRPDVERELRRAAFALYKSAERIERAERAAS